MLSEDPNPKENINNSPAESNEQAEGPLLFYTLDDSFVTKYKYEERSAIHNLTGENVSIRIYDKKLLSQKDLWALKKEAKILNEVKHPNIQQLYEIIEDESKYYLVLEPLPTKSLAALLDEGIKHTEEAVSNIFHQLLNAVEYLHSAEIVHQRLTPSVLFVNAHGVLKIAGFDHARFFSPLEEVDQQDFISSFPLAVSNDQKDLLSSAGSLSPTALDTLSCCMILRALLTNHWSNSLDFGTEGLEDISLEAKETLQQIHSQISGGTFSIHSLRDNALLKKHPFAPEQVIDIKPWSGYSKGAIPLDETVFEELVQCGLLRTEIEKSIQDELPNHLAASYYLLQRRHLKFFLIHADAADQAQKEAHNNNEEATHIETSQVDKGPEENEERPAEENTVHVEPVVERETSHVEQEVPDYEFEFHAKGESILDRSIRKMKEMIEKDKAKTDKKLSFFLGGRQPRSTITKSQAPANVLLSQPKQFSGQKPGTSNVQVSKFNPESDIKELTPERKHIHNTIGALLPALKRSPPKHAGSRKTNKSSYSYLGTQKLNIQKNYEPLLKSKQGGGSTILNDNPGPSRPSVIVDLKDIEANRSSRHKIQRPSVRSKSGGSARRYSPVIKRRTTPDRALNTTQVVQFSWVTRKSISTIRNELLRHCTHNGIQLVSMGSFAVRCQKNEVKFDIEINSLRQSEQYRNVTIKHYDGDIKEFVTLASAIISILN